MESGFFISNSLGRYSTVFLFLDRNSINSLVGYFQSDYNLYYDLECFIMVEIFMNPL